MRVVLDTDVVVAALRSPTGASAALLRSARDGKLQLLLSVPLALEYEVVLQREEHRRAAGVTEREVGDFLDGLIALSEPVRIHYLWRPRLRDANDEMVLEAAANGRADALVTFNRRDFGAVPAQLGIELWLPREAVARLRR